LINKIIKELDIRKLVYRGYGLGFHDSKPVFVSNAVPGDVVNVCITYKKKDVYFAEIEEIVRHADQRIKPSCEAFGICGGCEWLNINYRSQLNYKEEIIREMIKDLEVEQFLPIEGSDSIERYRNKSFLPVSAEKGTPVFGIYARKTHKVVPHRSCRLNPSIFNELGRVIIDHAITAKVKIYNEKNNKGNLRHIGFRVSKATGEILVILVTRNRKLAFTKQLVNKLLNANSNIVGIIQNINPESVNRILGEDHKLLYGRDYITDKIGDMEFRLNYNSFFQVNNSTMQKLYDFVKAEVPSDVNLLDAYSGIGTIGLYSAEKVKQVYLIEENESAIKDGIYNSSQNRVENAVFISGSVDDNLENVCTENKIDVIIFDPPRKGLTQEIIESVSQNRIGKVIYVSCNPATQMRDLHRFIEHGYRIIKMKPFDMFPHTYHIENVAILERSS